MSPSRAEVWLVDLGYVAKVRPALVLSIAPPQSDRDLVSLVPHTTSPRGSRFEVVLNLTFLKPGAFDAQNPVTISRAKLIRRLGMLAPDQLGQIEDAVRIWLGL